MIKKKKRPSGKKQTPTAADLLGIAARIGKLADEAVPSLSWRDRVKAVLSGCEDISEGMIRAGKIIRDAGIDIDFANMSICIGVEDIAADRIKDDAELAKISRAIDAVNKAHGLGEDEYWPLGEAPEDVEKLNAAFDRRDREIKAAVLREFGENEMADALLADEAAFHAKYREPGRIAHFGPLPAKGIPGLDK